MAFLSYFYFYDAFLNQRGYQKDLEQIETRITDLGLEGRVSRLGLFKNVKDMLKEAIRRGAETIVAVGNDDTARRVIEIFPDFRAAFGMIPLGQPTAFADFLGIPYGAAACDILSARIVEKIDVGKINDQYFLQNIAVPETKRVRLTCEDKYAVTTVGSGFMEVCNLNHFSSKGGEAACNPRDGVLETFVSGRRSRFAFWRYLKKGDFNREISRFPSRRVTVQSDEPVTILKDGGPIKEKSFKIEVAPQKLRIITGRGRKF